MWAVDEAADKGRITVLSDSNFIVDWYLEYKKGVSEDMWKSNPLEFLDKLLLDSQNNALIVANGGNPNDNFGTYDNYFESSSNDNKYKILNSDFSNIVNFTDEEIDNILSGEKVTIRLNVTENEDAISVEDKTIINNNLVNNKLGMYMDASLFKKVGNGEEEKLTTLGDNIQLEMLLDDKFINTNDNVERTYSILRVHDGNADIIPCVFNKESKTLVFETNKFSSYALIYSDTSENLDGDIVTENNDNTDISKEDNKTENPNTSDNIMFYVITFSVSLIGICLIPIIKKHFN